MKEIFISGLLALKEYVALHVLTCLIPAFLLAGALVTFVNRESILNYLGEKASRTKSFTLAAGASFFVAACSCTVIPVASGLYYAGAGIGAAFVILWVAPAANILALTYTESILGSDLLIARIAGALLMAYAVGFIMSSVFREERPASTMSKKIEKKPLISKKEIILLALLVASLLLPNYLVTTGPYIDKVMIWSLSTVFVALYAWKTQTRERISVWLRETWWFVKTIFPLLLLGVFLVGVISTLIPEELVRNHLGGNGFLASFLATIIGSLTYFATMTEAPFVDMLMNLGMGKGPALALLLTGPGLSLPNWLAIARVFGIKKALVYVPTIIVLGTLTGWFFGNFIFLEG